MLNLYTSVVTKTVSEEKFAKGEKLSVYYHNLFDYALSFADLIRWRASDGLEINQNLQVMQKNGYFFLEGKESLIYQRLLRKRISAKKLEIAKKASKAFSFIPWVKMVAATGSLAMENSTEGSDVDLLIITQKGRLWTTRLVVYFLARILGVKTRKPFDRNEKDKLCLNMWLDAGDLVWRQRNIYTAHEIAQIVPLVSKDNTYERFLSKNEWILKFWPNAVRIQSLKFRKESKISFGLFEWLAYKIQYLYMKKKVTNEAITPTRALFHPQDWSKVVLDRLEGIS